MASIPGWAYAVVGAAIAIYAKYVSSKKPSTIMGIFFWIGLALLAIGVFKLLLRFIAGKRRELRGEEKRPDERPAHTRDSLVCPRCNAKLNPQSRYCNWCGTRQ